MAWNEQQPDYECRWALHGPRDSQAHEHCGHFVDTFRNGSRTLFRTHVNMYQMLSGDKNQHEEVAHRKDNREGKMAKLKGKPWEEKVKPHM